MERARITVSVIFYLNQCDLLKMELEFNYFRQVLIGLK